ncbi:Hcp family type VI secretion system effector [Andreprevotia chitinilytica]|uniref:Hcp family type VI secretion system effector n=1 Tax=Andreprevotia chitinilytica TaxID=396808 RepID=UPI00054FFBBC|nr:type VI secretion system tube protein Hcp [Andreprevotia chitinilytica]
MDLILLEPGDQDIFGGDNSWTNGGSLIDNTWRDGVLNLKKCIELVSIHHGMKQQVTTDVSNSARTSGRPVITEFTCVKYVDKTSVKFYDYCLRAQPLGKDKGQPTKIYIARNSGDKTANIMTIALRDALISEIQFQSHPDDMPTEQFKISFTEIVWTYTVQLADTGTAGNISSGWSVSRNRPIGQFTD